MKRTVRKELVLAIGICLIAVLIAGCERQSPSNAREDKLAAYENKQLKEQVAQQEKEFGEQTAQLEKKIKEQNRLLRECQQKKEILEEKFEEQVHTSVSNMMDIFGDTTEQLAQENDQLKAQVEELQGRARKLEQELEKLKSPAEPQPLTP